MSQQPESGTQVLKLYAIELPDGSIAMNGPYVLATENEGQAGRMAHARDGQEIAFVREIQQAQGVGELSPIHYMRDNHTFKRLSEHVPTAMVEIEQEFNSGYTYGMLCSKRPGFVSIHANGNKNRMEFLKACEDRLKQQAATPQSSAPVVGDELASLYDAASVGFHISESCGPERKFLRITSFPSLDALQAYEDAWTEAMVSVRDARRESALTGRG